MSYYDPRALGLNVAKISGTEAYVLCPYHNDHTPSASFSLAKGVFHCFTCGTNKSAVDIARDLGGEIVQYTTLPKINSEELVDWRGLLNCPKAYNHPYLVGRGVSNDAVDEFDIRRTPRGVGVPIRGVKGDVIGFQDRKSTTGYGPRYLTFGKTSFWPIAKYSSTLTSFFVVEGVFGVMNAWKHGYTAFAIMGAGNIDSADNVMLGRASKQDFRVLFDDDKAGYLGAAKLAIITNCSARVIVPGRPADEIGQAEWDKIAQDEGKRFALDIVRYAPEQDRDMVMKQILGFVKTRNRQIKKVTNVQNKMVSGQRYSADSGGLFR